METGAWRDRRWSQKVYDIVMVGHMLSHHVVAVFFNINY
jgi:hypothetical protein